MLKSALRVLRSRDFSTLRWSGGTSTQLYIYPAGSDYTRRDFLFRLSTATVEAEESTFSALPGFKRVLMVLEGELTINHSGHYEKKLRAFGQDEFDGGWETTARGRAVDFNLMLASQARGSVHHHALAEGEEFAPDFSGFAFVYVYEGGIKVNGGPEILLAEKELLVIKDQASLAFKATKDSHIILAQVQLHD